MLQLTITSGKFHSTPQEWALLVLTLKESREYNWVLLIRLKEQRPKPTDNHWKFESLENQKCPGKHEGFFRFFHNKVGFNCANFPFQTKMEYLNTLQHHPLPFQNFSSGGPPEPKQVGNQLHVPKHLPQVKGCFIDWAKLGVANRIRPTAWNHY